MMCIRLVLLLQIAMAASAFFVIIATAISATNSLPGSDQRDENSTLVDSMNGQLQRLFEKISQLEVKVERMLEKQNELTERTSRIEAKVVDEVSTSESKNSGITRFPDAMEAKVLASVSQVNHIQTFLSQPENHLFDPTKTQAQYTKGTQTADRTLNKVEGKQERRPRTTQDLISREYKQLAISMLSKV